jgi:hypothetical protein
VKRLALLGCVLALVVAVAAFVAVSVLASTATEAYIISKYDDKKIELNGDMFDERAPNESESDYKFRVMGIYGGKVEYATPVVFVPRERFTHPKQMPSMTFLLVDVDKGWTPVQVKSLWFFTKYVVACAMAAFVALLILYLFLSGPPAKDKPSPA